MMQFIEQRIGVVMKQPVVQQMTDTKGILIHYVPANFTHFLQTDLSDPVNQDRIKTAMRHFVTAQTTMNLKEEGLLIATGNTSYQLCYKNGIIEFFRNKLDTANLFNPVYKYIKTDTTLLTVNSFLKGASAIHEHYKTPAPFYVFVTFINVRNYLIYSLSDRFLTSDPIDEDTLALGPVEQQSYSDPIERKTGEAIISAIKMRFNCTDI